MAIIYDSASPLSTAFCAPLPAPPSLSAGFFEPLLSGVGLLPAHRICHECPDELWLRAGVWRCLTEQHSGRAFLQTNARLFPNLPEVVPYFDSLRSERRLDLVLQASDALYERLASASNLADPFAQHPELAGFRLFAGDGHYHAAAVHDPRVLGAKDVRPNPPPRKNKSMNRVRVEPAGTQDAVGHFFALNLRNQLMRHLVVADQEERRKPF